MPYSVNSNIGHTGKIENIESKHRFLSAESFRLIKLNLLFIEIKNYVHNKYFR